MIASRSTTPPAAPPAIAPTFVCLETGIGEGVLDEDGEELMPVAIGGVLVELVAREVDVLLVEGEEVVVSRSVVDSDVDLEVALVVGEVEVVAAADVTDLNAAG
jgi:hypothetical protein